MARSSDYSLHGQPMKIESAKSNMLPFYRLIAHRRIRYTPMFALFIACSVFLSVTVSFLVTTIIARNVEVLSARVFETNLPFDGFIAFPDIEDAYDFFPTDRFLESRTTIEAVPWAEMECSLGRLFLIGTGSHLSENTIEFLFPFSQDSTKTKPAVLSAWTQNNPSIELNWFEILAREPGDTGPAQGLYGWASVNPSVLEKLPGHSAGVVINILESFSTPSLRDRIYRQIESYSHKAKVVTPFSGKVTLENATKGAFSYWQFVSVIVLLASSTAITCVLTVSFLGRKRSLGILRVLGSTIKDLRRSMSLEATYIGAPGIIAGVLTGQYLSRFLQIGSILPLAAYFSSIIVGGLTLVAGVYIPLRLIKNANCDQLLNNKPVYVVSNPSCADCGLCGGI